MESEQIISCFISAPFGFDLTLFKEILIEHDIEISDQSSLKLGESLPELIKKKISQSNLFCAIIPQKENADNIFFEIGIAFAKNKPILLFLGKNINLPLELKNISYFNLNIDDPDSVRLYIESFLNFGIQKTKNKRVSKQVQKSVNLSWFDNERNLILNQGSEQFEQNIVKIFKKAGYLTESQFGGKDAQIDIAIWIDNLENYFGNPILVEIKNGDLNKNLIKSSENLLRKQVIKIGGNLGLIVYNDKNGKNFSELSKTWPLIIKFNIEELVNLIKNGKFETTIIEIRNKMAHGIS